MRYTHAHTEINRRKEEVEEERERECSHLQELPRTYWFLLEVSTIAGAGLGLLLGGRNIMQITHEDGKTPVSLIITAESQAGS